MTQKELESRSIKELKEIAAALDITIEGDARKKSTWIEAINGYDSEVGDQSSVISNQQESNSAEEILGHVEDCPDCEGTGLGDELEFVGFYGLGEENDIADCKTCNGTGLIHAAKRPMKLSEFGLLAQLRELGVELPANNEFPYGAIVAQCELKGCHRMTDSTNPDPFKIDIDITTVLPRERMVGDWRVGRYAWKLENVQPLFIPEIKGHQGLWHFKPISEALCSP